MVEKRDSDASERWQSNPSLPRPPQQELEKKVLDWLIGHVFNLKIFLWHREPPWPPLKKTESTARKKKPLFLLSVIYRSFFFIFFYDFVVVVIVVVNCL